MSIEGFKLDTYSFKRNELSLKGSVFFEDQCAFITKFYPSPKFIEMDFEETQASSNGSSFYSQQSQISSSEKKNQSQFSRSDNQNINNEEDQVSEIQANHIGLIFNSSKYREKDLKSFNQSQFDYRQMIDELNCQDKNKKVHQSSKKKNYHQHFNMINDHDKSFASQEHEKIEHFEVGHDKKRKKLFFKELGYKINDIKKKQTVQIKKQDLKCYLPWDIQLKRKNKIKAIIYFVKKSIFSIFQHFITNLYRIAQIKKMQEINVKNMEKDKKNGSYKN